MKTLSAATQAHLSRDVTTLAVLWRVTRTDGVVHRLTDHDRDVLFLVDQSLTVAITAPELYRAIGGFSRSAIASRAGLQVDNLDLTGLITEDGDPIGITLDDLVARRLNFAQVEVFACDWAAPDDGVVPLKRGRLGEVKLRRGTLTYEAELRGLAGQFGQKIGRLASPTCDAGLFDSRCGLSAATFTQRVTIASVTDRRTFTVPTAQVLAAPEPSLLSGARAGATVNSDGALTLRLGALELGTRDAPFLVSTPAELDAIRDNAYAWYALAGDVDMGSFGFFAPIEDFRGGLDGRGHEIQNLQVDRVAAAEPDGDAALFRDLLQGAVVRRLGIRGGSFQTGDSTQYFAAPLCARTNASAQAGEYGLIEDCYAIGCEVLDDAASPDRVSGLVGRLTDWATLRRCFSSCVLRAPSATTAWGTRVGNLVAETDASGGIAPEDSYVEEERQLVGYSAVGTEEAGLHEDLSGVGRLASAQSQDSSGPSGLDFARAWARPESDAGASYSDTGGETLDFNDLDPSRSTLTRSAGSWITDGFAAGDRIEVSGTGTVVTSSPASVDFADSSLATITRASGDFTADGWQAGLLAVVSGSQYDDGTYLVIGATATVLTLHPGHRLTASADEEAVTISSAGNDGPRDVLSISASTLTMARGSRWIDDTGVAGSGVTIVAAARPRLRSQEAVP